ncbi:hypothetical protein D9M72_584850 [compost metagenome]
MQAVVGLICHADCVRKRFEGFEHHDRRENLLAPEPVVTRDAFEHRRAVDRTLALVAAQQSCAGGDRLLDCCLCTFGRSDRNHRSHMSVLATRIARFQVSGTGDECIAEPVVAGSLDEDALRADAVLTGRPIGA